MRFADGSVDGDVKTVGSIDPALLEQVVDLGRRERWRRPARDRTACWWPTTSPAISACTPATNCPCSSRAGQVPLIVRGDLPTTRTSSASSGSRCRCWSRPSTLDVGTGGTSQDSLVLVRTAGGATPATQRRLVRELATDFPNISVLTRARVPRRSAGPGRPVPHRADRDPHAVGDHRHPRDHQHARAVGVRAHPRARPAPRRRACRAARCGAWCGGSRW